MAARRLIVAMLALLVLSSIAAALIPVENNRTDDSSTTPSTTPAANESGRLIKRTVSAGADHRPTIPMRVGDQLQLRVTSPVPNLVSIDAFGELEDVDPNFPASFDLLPFDPGKFAVRLVDPPGLVATIQVKR